MMLDPFKEIINGHELWMLPVKGGTFYMGSPEDDTEAFPRERPQHKVAVNDFHMGKFPVTQALWRAVSTALHAQESQNRIAIALELSPSRFQGEDLPVEQVSWDDTKEFIQKLNDLTSTTRPSGYSYRLPTEAEWEYAARGGKHLAERYKYAGSDLMKDVGWFRDNSGGETKPVGLKYPNQLGIHDMSGNVFEWCQDWYGDSEYYEKCKHKGIIENPLGPASGTRRVDRGGGWGGSARYCRITDRGGYPQHRRDNDLGFRLVLSL